MRESGRVKAHLWTRNFILLSAANFLMFAAFYFLIPVLPVYITGELQGSNTMVGLVLAIYTLAALLVRPFTGFALDGLGRRTIYLVAMIAFTMLFNLYLVATSILFLFLVRFVHGLSWGITTTSGATIAVDVIPPSRRGEGIGIYGLSYTIAMAVGPLLGIVLLGQGNFTLVFIAAFVLSLAGWLLALAVRYPLYLPDSIGKINLKTLFEPVAMPVSVNLLVFNITYGGIISFIALYALELGVTNPGLFFLIYALGVTLSRPSAGRVFDRKGPSLLIGLGSAFIALGFLLITSWKTPAGFYLSAGLLGFGGGVITPTFQAMVNNLIETRRRGAANSTLFTALDLGIGIGMVCVGLLSEILDLTAAFQISSAIALCGMLLFYTWVFPHYKKHHLLVI